MQSQSVAIVRSGELRHTTNEILMDVIEIIGAGVAIIGAALAVLAFWRDLGDYRARRYNERFKSLLDMSAAVSDLGPYAGVGVSSKSEKAHEAMLSQFDLEARANAVLYLQSAGRLNRAGSTILAGGLLVYGAVLAVIPFVMPGTAPAEQSPEATIGAFLARALFVVLGLGFVGRGVVESVRRWSTRRIRLAVGASDDLTREAMKEIIEGLRARSAPDHPVTGDPAASPT